MHASQSDLTEIIDRSIASGDVSSLLTTLDQYLAGPVPYDIRAAAREVTELAGPGGDKFELALAALQRAMTSERARQEMSKELADDPELLQEFLVETREHLAGVESGILSLEQDPGNAETLNAVFRCFHSIKGLAGFMGASAVQELAHVTEDLLDLARSGKLQFSEDIAELILKAADELNRCLNKATGDDLAGIARCDADLLAAIASAARQGSSAKESAPDEGRRDASRAGGGGPAVNNELEAIAVVPATISATPKNPSESSVVRVETSKLEYLIDMVGELVIAESVVRNNEALKGSKDPLLSRNLTQLARVVREVQKTSMSMRMVAVGSLFRKMSRLTRDLARKSGKSIELVTIGDDVELDRSIVEDLADPLVHMIRNSVDHGLETVDERIAAGKPGKGTIRLSACHDAGDIVIELADDGRGMNAEKILAKARRVGLVAEGETPDEDTIFCLIFEAGFSTADKVTDLSGRGVGLDVVRKQIQKLRGRIAIRSAAGKGCTFVLRLPLTLAIIDGLVAGVGAQRFILPMFAVREMFSPKPGTFVALQNKAEAALFREKLLPVVRLSRLFGTPEEDRDSGVLVVVEGRDQLYCIAVDQLIGKQEVVIKSLGSTFRDVPAISGGAILGDGRVGLIIDVNSLRYPN